MTNSDILEIDNLPRLYRHALVIRWELTRFCNYACDFCIQGSHALHMQAAREESPKDRKEIATRLAAYVEKHVHARQMVEIHLIGGEVTALPDFPELMEVIAGCQFRGNIDIHLTTNFFRPSDYWKNLFSLFSGKAGRRLFINASFYKRYTTEGEFAQKINDLTPFLALPGGNPFSILRYRLLPLFWGRAAVASDAEQVYLGVGWPILDDASYHAFLSFKSRYGHLLHSVNPIIIRNYPVPVSEEIRDRLNGNEGSKNLRVLFRRGGKRYFHNIQQLGNWLADAGHFCPSGYICDAGKNSFSISPDGTVSRCPVLNPPADFQLGSFLDGSFRLLRKPAVCSADHCSCNYFRKIQCGTR